MKKNSMAIILSALLMTGLFTGGCTDAAAPASREEGQTENSTPEAMPSETAPVESVVIMPAESIQNTTVVQGGPYGEISLSIPDGWEKSEELLLSMAEQL